MLSDRYRIVGLLGRGGMGEVYRADDLKLGRTVALKFLPPELESDPDRLQMLLAEVRHARQVSHPNICRVYDVGEVGGSHFISMEFVDGEDLAGLMRRIGHLPADKATQVARQICAGIAAAHDQGILHRDLKPANIMLDGRGRARITDFGLALATGEGAGADRHVVGTPAYMAPEQLLTGTATPRSDLYALGLILHELFTGKRVFATTDFAALRAMHAAGGDSLPSALSIDLDPAVERVIARCLARDPRDRPSSALQVAAALPGGDPLAAALAAGETPSPELVASAATVGALSLRAAAILGLSAIALLGVILAMRSRSYAAVTTPITTLQLRATELLRQAGVPVEPQHRAQGFVLAPRLDGQGTGAHLKGGEEPQDIFYWRRWSARPMTPGNIHRSVVQIDEPAYGPNGSAMIVLDRGGRLVALDVVAGKDSAFAAPPVAAALDSAASPALAPFGAFLAAAGFDTTRLVAVAPSRPPAIYADRVAAWRQAGPAGSAPLRQAEAGAVGGRVVHFALTDSAHTSAEIGRAPAPARRKDSALDWLGSFLYGFGQLALAVWLARRNLAVGRGDRRGATRVAVFVFVVNLLEGVFAHSLADAGLLSLLDELSNGKALGHALLHAVTTWFAYVAIEPYVRRVWPDMLVAWARLTSGRVRDPLVGRDVVVGGVAGMALVVLTLLAREGAAALGWLAPAALPTAGELGSLSGLGVMAFGTVFAASISVLDPLWALVVVLLVHFLVRRRTWSAVLAWLLAVLVATFTAGDPAAMVSAALYSSIGTGILLFILVRFGLLAGMVATFVGFVLMDLPATLDLSAWYADRAGFGVLVVVALLAWGFRTALAGQAVFRDPFEEPRPSV
jgi:serine/threonine-protein kinase